MIYPSITTTTITPSRNDYIHQINEAKKLNLNEVCLFLTCLDLEKRKNLYKILETSTFNKIPLVHLRHDMELWELDYLWQKFQVQAFNIHPQNEYPLTHDLSKQKNHIFVELAFARLENFHNVIDLKKDFGGICIDFTHLEDMKLREPEKYADFESVFDQIRCGCAHLGPIEKEATPHPITGIMNYQTHYFSSLTQFDYLKNYPKKYFPEIIALEVENSLEEQLKAIKYIQKTFPNYF
jgi:hypothetical protein